MRNAIKGKKRKDPRLVLRGKDTSRLDNLTDAIFGFAITLLVFNVQDVIQFSQLLDFAKAFPALLIGILFLITIWREHLSFSNIYSLDDEVLKMLNVVFLTLVIFYVYPLRFLTKLLTYFIFKTNLNLNIQLEEVPQLMIFYGLVTFSMYLIFYFSYVRVMSIREKLELNSYEILHTKLQTQRIIIMFSIPLLSAIITYALQSYSIGIASLAGGMTYWLYPILILLWQRRFNRLTKEFVD